MDRSEKTWRCPYCDGLNDWQDMVCQICGDGKRPEKSEAQKVKTQRTEPSSSVQSKAEKAEPRKAKAPEPTKSRQESPKAKASEQIKSKQEPLREKAPEPEKPKTEVPKPESQKKKHTGRNALIAGLILVAGVAGYQHMGDRTAKVDLDITGENTSDLNTANLSTASIAEQVDFTLLEECPNDVNTVEGKEWLKANGYQTGDTNKINEGMTDWEIAYPTGSAVGMQIRYTITSQKYQNLAELYQQLSDRMKETSFTEVCAADSEQTSGLEFPQLSIWQSEKGTLYDLWSNGETLTLVREFDGSYFGETDSKNDYDLNEAKNQVNFDKLVQIDMVPFLTSQQWFDQFRSEYDPECNVVLGVNEEEHTVDVGFYYCASNKGEILRYLMDGLANALKQAGSEGNIRCEASWEDLSDYQYYIDTGKSLISIESGSINGTVTMTISGPTE